MFQYNSLDQVKELKKVDADLEKFLANMESRFITWSKDFTENPALSNALQNFREETSAQPAHVVIAAYHQHLMPLIKFLGTTSIVDYDGGSVFTHAASNGHTALVKALLAAVPGINVNHASRTGGWFPLLSAAYHGHAETVKFLITVPGILVNKTNKENRTAFFYAAGHGHIDVVKLLLPLPGTDVNHSDPALGTAFQWAKRRNDKDMLNLLGPHLQPERARESNALRQ